MSLKRIQLVIACLSLGMSSVVWSDDKVYLLEIKNHLFYPSELLVPTGVKFKLVIINHDATPEEFDSFDLNREKVIYPNRKATIYIGPLKAGRFGFFGEYNPNTAVGALIAIDKKAPSHVN